MRLQGHVVYIGAFAQLVPFAQNIVHRFRQMKARLRVFARLPEGQPRNGTRIILRKRKTAPREEDLVHTRPYAHGINQRAVHIKKRRAKLHVTKPSFKYETYHTTFFAFVQRKNVASGGRCCGGEFTDSAREKKGKTVKNRLK